jgi:hypothetical protein
MNCLAVMYFFGLIHLLSKPQVIDYLTRSHYRKKSGKVVYKNPTPWQRHEPFFKIIPESRMNTVKLCDETSDADPYIKVEIPDPFLSGLKEFQNHCQ